jgi:hypothetical protein
MIASPVGLSKKILNKFWFLTCKLLFAKIRVLAFFRLQHGEGAAINIRRFCLTNPKGL